MEFQLNRRSAPPIFATESIRTQFDDIGAQIEAIVTNIAEVIENKTVKSAKSLKDHGLIKSLEKLIFDRFKIKVHVVTHLAPAAIMPFYSNKNHIFLNEIFRGRPNLTDQNKLLKQLDQKKGSVNLEKATVGGIFSEYDHPLYLNFHTLIGQFKLSSTEITTVMLHELGHAFYACYYSDRTDRTNQVLAGVVRHLHANETGDIEYVYRELSKVSSKIPKEEIDKMLNGPRTVAGAAFFKVVSEIVRAQTTDDTYNETAFEQRADNFASRFGYGKPLILSLEKLSAGSGEKNIATRTFVHLLNASLLLVLCFFLGITVLAANVLGIIVFGFYTHLFFLLSREDYRDYTYDDLKFRYLRVRQDMIDQLKEIKEDKEVVKKMLDGIYAIDEAIKSTAVVRTLPSVISNFIFSGARQAAKSVKEQQLMEALASNELFVKSAELSLKA